MTYRRVFLAGVFTALATGLVWGCSAAETGPGPLAGAGGDNGVLDSGKDDDAFNAAGMTGDPDGVIVLNELCGKHPKCVPDFPPRLDLGTGLSCETFQPPPVSNGGASTGGGASESAPAGSSGEGGASGASGASGSADGGSAGASALAGAGGASSEAGAGASAGAGGMSGAGGDANVPPAESAMYGCQVQRTAGAPRFPTSECSLVGTGGDSAPCLTSADCKVGFGCVGDQNAGLCQAYCCESADNCKQGKYCAERALRDDLVNAQPKGTTDTSSALMIPVCVPAENCDLGAPYPCTKGSQCACPAETACLVVRADGTTTCAAPGTGTVGEACPCAWGHVCSAVTNTCLQLCYAPGTPSCGTGRCQAASELPDGWGVCVGPTPSGG